MVESPNCVYISLLINLHEQQECTFVQFSYLTLTNNWYLSPPIIINISVADPSIKKKNWYMKKTYWNALNVCSNKNWIGSWSVIEIWKNNMLILLFSTQKLYFGTDDAIYDVIMKESHWKWRHYYILRGNECYARASIYVGRRVWRHNTAW